MNRLDTFMVKAAGAFDDWQQERRKSHNIREALKRSEAKSYREHQVERLAGRQYSGGQLARGGAIGAGFGAAANLAGSLIEGGKKGLAGSLKNPRRMVSSALKGSVVGAVVPSLKRKADVRAAEEGWF